MCTNAHICMHTSTGAAQEKAFHCVSQSFRGMDSFPYSMAEVNKQPLNYLSRKEGSADMQPAHMPPHYNCTASFVCPLLSSSPLSYGGFLHPSSAFTKLTQLKLSLIFSK